MGWFCGGVYMEGRVGEGLVPNSLPIVHLGSLLYSLREVKVTTRCRVVY